MQGEIAARVASAMQVALGGATQAQLARAPSADPVAYELYVNANPLPAYRQRALDAARRAMALDPRGTHGHRAMGQYYLSVERENERAAQEVEAALRVSPRDVALLSLASSIKESSGQLEEALRDRAATLALDPLSAVRWNGYAMSLLRLRRYAEARTASLRAVALAPTSLNTNWTLMLADVGEGNVAAARKVIARASRDASPSALAAEVATYFDLGWTLDAEHEQLLLVLGPDAFDDDRALWALVLAQQYHTRGDQGATRAWGDSAVRYNAEMVRQSPDEASPRGALALSLAYAARTSEAMAEAERAVGLARQRTGAGSLNVPYFVHILARVYTLAGEKDKAVAALEEVVRLPFFVSRATLRVDPTFAPLKGNPGFERLVAGM